MFDQYGRKIEYIRISITDRCNLRCMYCMPKDGIEQVEHGEILTYDEITRLCRILAGMGISKVKITGGEPLVRRGAAALIKQLKEIPGIDNVTLTTNGMLLKSQMKDLAEAGLDAVNISLDAMEEEVFDSITRKSGLEQVLLGMDEALKYPEVSVKVNCVLLDKINDGQWMKIAALARDRKIDVRFIEMMPIGYGQNFTTETEERVKRMLSDKFGAIRSVFGTFGNGPSTYVSVEGFQGKIGFISAVSHKFCQSCNRMRLTSEGFLKPCLQYACGADLRTLLRDGSSDETVAEAAGKVIFEKPRSHHFEERGKAGFEHKKMSEIGG